VTEIRSYRCVFDLERRIYRIDRLRLNPSGVPVLGIVYFLVLLVASLLLARAPVFSIVGRHVPWYIRTLLLPALSAALLSVVRIEGRPFHLAAHALLRFGLGPRWLAGVRPCRGLGSRWYPQELLMLPDGSDARMRKLLYAGPGAALIAVPYARLDARRRLQVAGGSLGKRLRAQELGGRASLAQAEVIELARGAQLLFVPASQGHVPLRAEVTRRAETR
jgi:hypothetical protein